MVELIKFILNQINEDYKEQNELKENDSKDIDIKNDVINNQGTNFKLILPLAKGGYGSVGLYKKITTGDLYAIKSVNILSMKEKKLSKTLGNERNILKEISNDYIVNSYYIFKDKKNYYFVMEYLPGGDVYHLLSNIILPFTTIQLIVAETLLAVNYLHSINIIHHDIKLENILIAKDGHFKLSDFGLSKIMNEDETKNINNNKKYSSSCSSCSSINNSINQEYLDNKVEGTLFYMAPELFNNGFPVGKAIDYWAIGIVIYELFTFKVPFEAETQELTQKNIVEYNVNWEYIYAKEIEKSYGNYVNIAVDLIKKFIFFNPSQRWGDHNFKEIQEHEFFKGLDWQNIKKAKNSVVLSYLKKVVEKNNNKIKELNKDNKEQKNNIICSVDLDLNEMDIKYSQRIDNLQKRNNEVIRQKFKKKEIKIEDDENNFKRSLLFDLH